MNRGDIKLAYDRAIAHDVPDVADRLYEMAERISALEAHNAVLLAFVKNVSEQTPEKPDYWSSCGQCSHNASDAEDLIASTPESSLAEIRRAEWKPIETAPKDTFVLLAGPSGYTTIETVFATGRMCSDYHAGRWIDHANDDLTDWGFEPTHWMPLPKPPAIRQMED